LTDTASDMIEWLFTYEFCDEVTDMTEWLLSFPDMGSIMNVDEGNSTFVQNSEGTENNADHSGISTKLVEFSL